MKLLLAQLIAVLASIGFGEAGQRTGEIAFSQACVTALALGVVLMLITTGLEIADYLRERSLTQG